MNHLSTKKVLDNILKNSLYKTVLFFTFAIIILLFLLNSKFIYPLFYETMMKSVVDEAKKTALHLKFHLKESEQVHHDIQETFSQLQLDFDIEKIKLFNENGIIIDSTSKKDIGIKSNKEYFYNKVAKGEIYYVIVNKGNKTLEDRVVSKDVAEIYVPYIVDGKFHGAIEVYYDITDKKVLFMNLIDKINLINISISILLIIIVFIILYNASRNNIITNYTIKENIEKEKILQNQAKLASMGEMIGNIAHQWRQPLSVITSASSGIKLHLELENIKNTYMDDSLTYIEKNALYLSKTIEDFKNIINNEKKNEDLNIKDFFSHIHNIIEDSQNPSYINIIYNINPFIIKINESELFQVIICIINNAKDALEQNNIETKYIFIDAFEDEQNYNIVIKDNGGGINEKILDKIFEPYFTTKHKALGTGLGLYMAMKTVKYTLNGDLIAQNCVYFHNNVSYKGAEFVLKIPKYLTPSN